MLPPPLGRRPHTESLASAGPGTLLLLALAAGCGGGDSLEPTRQRTITRMAGDAQNAAAGSAVPIAPSVVVTDAGGNAVSGVAVTFQVSSGGGSVIPETPVNTDQQGVAATTSWTLGTTPGPNTLSATATGVTGSPVVFSATGLQVATIRGTITLSDDLDAARTRAAASRSLLWRGGAGVGSRPALRQPEYTPDELIVRFRPGLIGAPRLRAPAPAFRSAAAATEGRIRARIAPHLTAHAAALTGVSPAVRAARIRVLKPADIDRVSRSLRMDPAVASVERNRVLWSANAIASSTALPNSVAPTRANDPLSALQAWSYGMIDVPEAWSLTTGSASVLVAVVDDGIRFDHPDIAANLTSDGYDFVSDFAPLPLCSGGSLDPTGDGDEYDADPTTPTAYDSDLSADCMTEISELGGRGVAAAGIIGAVGNDAAGIAGINWSVRIRPVRVIGIDGRGTGYDVAQGILYAAGLPADDGAGGFVQAGSAARIINLSPTSPEEDPVVRDAVVAATSAGALIITPVGVSGSGAPEYPGALPEVVAVSGLRPDRELAFYSSFGSAVDIAAPGGDFSNGDASFGVLSAAWNFQSGGPDYASWQLITAIPHVTGVAALLLAQNPGLTPAEVRSRLTDYAVDAGPTGRDDQYGAGIVNARNSLAQNFAPPQQLWARLYDALTGGVVQTVAVAGDGSYSFPATDGSYRVFAGQDESGDQEIGLPGRRWGAFGGSAAPSPVDVNGVGTHQAPFTVGYPSELEPNETMDKANLLPIGGYLHGVISAGGVGGDDDMFRVQIPLPGEYTFETSGVEGSCGFALEEDTIVGLFRPDETAVPLTVELGDDIDPTVNNFCSRVTATMQPGTYFFRVQGYRGGSYRVQARSGA